MIKKTILGLMLLFFSFPSITFAQDTLTIMQYNVLSYGNLTTYCTNTNNSVAIKNGYIKTIVKHVMPDILTVNEISPNPTHLNNFLNNIMNTDGVTYYQKAQATNFASSYIVNMLFYNTQKLTLHSQQVVTTGIRDINLYKLYYNSPDLSSGDTAFIICISAHLKAGSASADETERLNMVDSVFTFLNSTSGADNFLIMGDFNVYRSSEPCFQRLLNYSNPALRFFDPANKVGNWHDNSGYASVHTQSTNLTSNGCTASGGMDDRFDFILSSGNIMNGLDKVQYVSGSYYALGQDGLRLNQSVSSPANNTCPSEVINALLNNSDHLPVIMKVKISQSPVAIMNDPGNIFSCEILGNPAKEFLQLKINHPDGKQANVKLFNLLGIQIWSDNLKLSSSGDVFNIPLTGVKVGVYIISVTDKNGYSWKSKIIVQ